MSELARLSVSRRSVSLPLIASASILFCEHGFSDVPRRDSKDDTATIGVRMNPCEDLPAIAYLIQKRRFALLASVCQRNQGESENIWGYLKAPAIEIARLSTASTTKMLFHVQPADFTV